MAMFNEKHTWASNCNCGFLDNAGAAVELHSLTVFLALGRYAHCFHKVHRGFWLCLCPHEHIDWLEAGGQDLGWILFEDFIKIFAL